MAKKGKLTTDEVFIARGMRGEGKSIDDIAKHLDRTASAIEKIVNVQEIHPEPKPPVVKTARKVLKEGIEMLVLSGMDKDDARELVARAMEKQPDKEWKTAKGLMAAALRCMNAKHLMGRKAAGGRKGVTIMTRAASERGDESGKVSRGRQPGKNIWNIRDGKMQG